MDLDLDDLQYANVKLKGKLHKVRLPSVIEVHSFENSLRKNAKDTESLIKVYSDYFVGLGMDVESAEGLNMYQFQTLHRNLAGLNEKK